MTIYLTIMVTVLVATQIIRITQNAIQLHRQHEEIRKYISWFDERDVSERDFDVQRECFYLLRDKLKTELGEESPHTTGDDLIHHVSYEPWQMGREQ